MAQRPTQAVSSLLKDAAQFDHPTRGSNWLYYAQIYVYMFVKIHLLKSVVLILNALRYVNHLDPT